MTEKTSLTAPETRAALSLAGIFSMRMLGLFMIYPVFALYARRLPDATAATIGLALGIYGLTQALCQIPFGMLSDRVGRKPMIIIGLLLFAAGSALAAMSDSIYGIILGRALQGGGAVGSVILALTADLTRDEVRTRAMAIVGMTIGLSFGVAVVAGPVLNAWVGVPGIFWLTAGLALVGIAILQFLVPKPVSSTRHRDTEPVPALFKRVLKDPQLLRLDFGILAQHAILTATFLAVPVLLRDHAGVAPAHQWYVYLPVMVLSVFGMVPLIILAEKYGKMKPVFLGGVAAIGLSQLLLLFWHARLLVILPALLIFFTAFNLLEASLPSLISKLAPPESKGTAMGVYSSSQFFGIFLGGTVGGLVQQHFHMLGVFVFSALLAGLWLLAARGMRVTSGVKSRIVRLGRISTEQAADLGRRLAAVAGVRHAVVVAEEGVAYLKVGRDVDEAALAAVAGQDSA